MENLLKTPENKIKDISKILNETTNIIEKNITNLSKTLSETRTLKKKNNQTLRSLLFPEEKNETKKQSEIRSQANLINQYQKNQSDLANLQKPKESEIPKPQTPGQITPTKVGALLAGSLASGQNISSIISSGAGNNFTISDVYGTKRDNNTHRGLDISGPVGTFIALKVDCEVLAASVNGDNTGFGKWIAVWVPSLGVQLLFGHCNSVFFDKGKLPAGKSFATLGNTGRSSGPHIHFQYSKSKNVFTTDGPPDEYVGYILLTKNKSEGITTTRGNLQSNLNLSKDVIASATTTESSPLIINNNNLSPVSGMANYQTPEITSSPTNSINYEITPDKNVMLLAYLTVNR